MLTRISAVCLCIVSTSAVASAQRVVETSARPDLEGRLMPSREVVVEPAMREVFVFDLQGRRRLVEAVESVRETQPNGDTSAVHTTWAPDVNGRRAVMSRLVERTQSSPSGVHRTETTFLAPHLGDTLRETERVVRDERRITPGVVGHESTYSIRDVNGRWQPIETRRGEVRDVRASERFEEETTQRLDVNGRLVDDERTVTRSFSANARDHVVTEIFARSDGRLALSQRVHRTTAVNPDGGRYTVEEVEARNPVAPSDPLRVIRRIVTTVRPVRTGGWVTEQEVFERDVNGRLLLVDRELTTSS
jgi:hypothetical protein